MTRSWKFLKNAKVTELLASAVLAFEALYFIIATLVVTGFGVVYAKGSADAYGLLGTFSLPLIAVGAFAIWSLALLHVLPPASSKSARGSESGDCFTSRRVSMTGFYVVVAAHLVYAVLLIGQERMLLAGAILLLTGLLLVCSLTQVHLPNKRRKAILADQSVS